MDFKDWQIYAVVLGGGEKTLATGYPTVWNNQNEILASHPLFNLLFSPSS